MDGFRDIKIVTLRDIVYVVIVFGEIDLLGAGD